MNEKRKHFVDDDTNLAELVSKLISTEEELARLKTKITICVMDKHPELLSVNWEKLRKSIR